MGTLKRYGIAALIIVVSIVGFGGCEGDGPNYLPSSVESPGAPFERYDGPDSNGNGRWDPSPLDPYQS